MVADSSIEWTDAVWNPVRGCSIVSPGCHSCYAMRQAHRFDFPGGPYEGTTKTGPNGPLWTGKVICVEDKLTEPLKWKKPRKVFVNSMSDLFHKDVPDSFIDKVFAVMALSRQHTYQLLTKRPDRMAAYLNRVYARGSVADAAVMSFGRYIWWNTVGHERKGNEIAGPEWPLPNVWLGVSCEDQQRADERIPHLLRTTAAVRFLSCEPLLSEVILHKYFAQCQCGHGHGFTACPNTGGVAQTCHSCDCRQLRPMLDWIIVGGESGHDARPCRVEWVRSLVKQCQAAGVACFVKQDSGPKPGQQGRIPLEIWQHKEFPHVA